MGSSKLGLARDAARFAALQTVAAEHAFELECRGDGELTLRRTAGLVVACADWRRMHLEVGGVRASGRQDRMPDDYTYDTVSDAEFPLEPDLLLMQQVLFAGTRFARSPGQDCVVSAPRRLSWPAGAPSLAHPALLDPKGAWQWPWDPLWTRASVAAGMGDRWIVDLPALVDLPVECVPVPRPELQRVTRAIETSAAADGFALTLVASPFMTAIVRQRTDEYGIVELEWSDDRWTLALAGVSAAVQLRVRPGKPVKAPWTEVFSAPAAHPLYELRAWPAG